MNLELHWWPAVPTLLIPLHPELEASSTDAKDLKSSLYTWLVRALIG